MDQARAFKTELLQDSRIAAVSLSSTIFSGPQINYGIESEGVEEPVFMRMYGVDGDFAEIMGLRMAQGRALTDDPADAQAVVINKTAAWRMGWAEPLGKTIKVHKEWRVVGVVEDFHFDGPAQQDRAIPHGAGR